jgi:GTP-binding protein
MPQQSNIFGCESQFECGTISDMFADKIEIEVKAGKGGDGLLSFRHEKYRARGGPDGGDGGRGGSVILQADHNLNTLSAFRTKRRVKAEDGQAGKANRSHGKNGEDVVLKVPEGTIVYEGQKLIADLTHDAQTVVIARGGRGGFGNAHFTSSTRQAPRAAELGEPGDESQLALELKLVADVGLIGLPNAGKSTLLSVISNAKPEIADYPFTTIIPNLGVVDFQDETFLVADIPGLIEGASQGKGLGDEFLRHVERTAVLIHLIDAHSEDIVGDYRTIQNELQNYALDLTNKPQIVAPTKVEGMTAKAVEALQNALSKAGVKTAFSISAAAHLGIDELLRAVLPKVEKARQERQVVEADSAIPVINEISQPDLWAVEKADKSWRVSGQKIEGFARRTDWDNDASVERLRDILRREGISRELTRQGIQPGEIVHIANQTLEWK